MPGGDGNRTRFGPLGSVPDPPCQTCDHADRCRSWMMACYEFACYCLSAHPDIMPFRRKPFEPRREIWNHIFKPGHDD